MGSMRHEEALLEIMRDSNEELDILTERRLLEWVSKGILPVGLASSPPRSKWLCKTQVSCSPTNVVSSSKKEAPENS